MHKLGRGLVEAPPCLSNYDHTTHEWSDFSGGCKRRLRLALQSMQGEKILADDADDYEESISGLRCAYCEAQIFHGGHIEHFRRKNRAHFPELMFSWTNLFIACGSLEHCGHYKDRSGSFYDPNELIKPDEHDPDEYLYFHSSGEVRVRERTPKVQAEERRAAETIRVFNLNAGSLRGKRKSAVDRYRNPEDLEEIMSWTDEDRALYIQQEIDETQWLPFSTTIRHFFEKLR
ncbi:TPA: retron system putative HNH endonuclease [Burkholderia ambifaria]